MTQQEDLFKTCKYCGRKFRIAMFVNTNTRVVHGVCQSCRSEAKRHQEAQVEDKERSLKLSKITRKILGKI